jgi:hypothetical protein
MVNGVLLSERATRKNTELIDKVPIHAQSFDMVKRTV